jgi:hypothetical protein
MGRTIASRSIRTGTGTIRRYVGDNSITVIGIERAAAAPHGKLDPLPALDDDKFCAGRTVFLTCEPALADDLLERYGVTDKAKNFINMDSVIGKPCRYVESACGMLVRLDILPN